MNMTVSGVVLHDCWSNTGAKAVRHNVPVRVESVCQISEHPVFGKRWRVCGVRCDGTIIEWTVNSDGEAVE